MEEQELEETGGEQGQHPGAGGDGAAGREETKTAPKAQGKEYYFGKPVFDFFFFEILNRSYMIWVWKKIFI